MHPSAATAELPCALRMGEEALTEAAQFYGGLSDVETCGDLDDNERESLREASSLGFRTAEDMPGVCDEVCWQTPNTKQTDEHITSRGLVLN